MRTGVFCESEWHPKKELKHFQRCPYCKSEAYHKTEYAERNNYV